MFEIIAGIIAGFMVKHWSSLFVFPCFIGLIQAIRLVFRPRKTRFSATEIARMREDGMTESDINKAAQGLEMLNRMSPSGWKIYIWQFAWSSITAFPFCLIVGGIRLLFF